MYKDPLKMALEFDQGCVDRTYIQYAPRPGGEAGRDGLAACPGGTSTPDVVRQRRCAWPESVRAVADPPHEHPHPGRLYSTKPLHNKWAI